MERSRERSNGREVWKWNEEHQVDHKGAHGLGEKPRANLGASSVFNGTWIDLS